MESPSKNYFISYNQADRSWAEWIAWQLEEAGYSTVIQAWDFRPGSNFVLEMQQATVDAERIIAILSPDYLSSSFTAPEWAAGLRRDPKGKERILVPVRVRECHPEGLLGQIVYLDLVGMDESEASKKLLSEVRERGKPLSPPAFPAEIQHSAKVQPTFPRLLLPLHNMTYQRNPFFTGRGEILERLHRAFTPNTTATSIQPQALCGLAGVGKTQIAVEYVYRYLNDYEVILWVRADTLETLISDFVTIAGVLDLSGKSDRDQNHAIDAVKYWLNSHTNWLLVFDNADNLTIVMDFLPIEGKGHTLLTTRSQSVRKMAKRVEVEKMQPDEGALFLLRCAKIIESGGFFESASEVDQAKAREISVAMDGLPLAIDQAGAYIEETSSSLSDYLDLYYLQRAELLKLRGQLIADHPDSVVTTWSLSFNKIAQANLSAIELLRFFAFLQADAIPEEMVTEGAPGLGPVLLPVASNPLKFNAAIGELLRYSFIRRNSNNKTFTIHHLLQDVLKDEMDSNVQHQWAERTVKAVNQSFPDVAFGTWQRCQRCLPHAEVCAQLIEQWKMEFAEATQLLNKACEYLCVRAQYSQAEPLCKQALEIRERTLKAGHLDVAQNLSLLSRIYRGLGRSTQAEPLCKQALEIRERVLGANHLDVAQSLNELAWLYIDQGKPAQAEPLCKRALSIRESFLGAEHLDVAESLNCLAWLYDDQAKYHLVEPIYLRALAIREKLLGPDHPAVAESLNNLAWFYKIQDEYQRAESLYQRALAIRIEALGAEHPDVATSLNNLARLHVAQRKYNQAEPLLQQALTIQERTLGLDHPKATQTFSNLAGLYHKQGKYDQAELLYKQALAIREQVLGPQNPKLATTLNDLAVLYIKQGNDLQAEPLLKRALTISEETLGLEHPGTHTILGNYISLLRRTNRADEAAKLEKRAKFDP